jgi:transposase
MYRDRLRDHEDESQLEARRQVGAMLDINPATMRNWIEREEVDSGARPGVTSMDAAEIKALRKENAELRRANEILKTASAFFAAAELDRRLK